MEVYDGVQFDNICRICFKPSLTLTSIFEKNLCNDIQEIVSIKIQRDDGLPSNLCNNCVSEIFRCNQFKELIINTDTKLRLIQTYRQFKGKSEKIDNDAHDESNEFYFGASPIDNNAITPEDNNDVKSEPLDPLDTNSTAIPSSSGNMEDVESNLLDPLDTSADEPTIDLTLDSTDNGIHRIHDRIEFVKFNCIECNIMFGSRNALTHHNRLVHQANGTVKCDQCGKCFDYPCTLERHIRSHRPVLPHACDVCSKTFKTKSSWTLHKKMHNREKTFKCQDCNKSYVSQLALTRHESTAHKILTRFKCRKCDKLFSSETTMINHYVKVHAEQK